MRGSQIRGLKYVLATAFISGFAIFANKFFVGAYESAYLYTTIKNVLAALMLVSVLILTREYRMLRGLSRRDWLRLASIGAVGGSIPFLLFFKGLTLTTAAQGAFIHKTLFLYVALLAAVFLREKLNAKMLAAALMLLAGNMLAIGLNAYTIGIGDLMILSATVLWATETIISKKALATIKPSVVAAARMGFGSIILLLYMGATGGLAPALTLTGTQVTAAAVTSIILFGYVTTWYNGLRLINASTATVVLLLGAPVTALLSTLFLSATVPAIKVAGFLLLLTGVALYVRLSLGQERHVTAA